MIFELMKKLGKSHAKLVTNIYHKILDVDKRFLAKEPDQNDPSYVAKIILIYYTDRDSHGCRFAVFFKSRPCGGGSQPFYTHQKDGGPIGIAVGSLYIKRRLPDTKVT